MNISDPVEYILLDPMDTVAILNIDGKSGQVIKIGHPINQTIVLQGPIPKGHKVALRPMKAGDPVLKFSQIIGLAKVDIAVGEHVHSHNIGYSDTIVFSDINLTKSRIEKTAGLDKLPSTFNGFLRKDGRAGIRNYVVVMATSNCSGTVVKRVASHFVGKDLARYGVDAVVPVAYGGGCAQATGTYAYTLLNRTLAGWFDHPNVVGAVIIGLGCEVITVKSIAQYLSGKDTLEKPYFQTFNIQDVGGTQKAIRLGIEHVSNILSKLPVFHRVPLPVRLLSVALNCGGSDVFSGLTANPSVGAFTDMLVLKGGTAVLAETPECHGAENYLIQRSVRQGDKEQMKNIVKWWDSYTRTNKVTMNDNISPGNMEGGISTILEKSLGAVAKGGTLPIVQVIDYGERITENGIVFMNTPGFDPVSVTGLVAGGCNMVVFTTGRGSVYGCSLAPTVKIATNSALYRALRHDMDIDAGQVLNDRSIQSVGKEIYRFVIKTASGEETCSERNGIGWEEFVPWSVGETL